MFEYKSSACYQRPSCPKFFCDKCEDAQQCDECFERICGRCNRSSESLSDQCFQVTCESCCKLLCDECDCGCGDDYDSYSGPPSTCEACGKRTSNLSKNTGCGPGGDDGTLGPSPIMTTTSRYRAHTGM